MGWENPFSILSSLSLTDPGWPSAPIAQPTTSVSFVRFLRALLSLVFTPSSSLPFLLTSQLFLPSLSFAFSTPHLHPLLLCLLYFPSHLTCIHLTWSNGNNRHHHTPPCTGTDTGTGTAPNTSDTNGEPPPPPNRQQHPYSLQANPYQTQQQHVPPLTRAGLCIPRLYPVIRSWLCLCNRPKTHQDPPGFYHEPSESDTQGTESYRSLRQGSFDRH